ncbi:MAG: LON peptidase substrate-binding domain-containing protein [Myxococcales bacterium]|nr:LON peptidase substrate-binding domain-containing protein [Myxococcales bacterium]
MSEHTIAVLPVGDRVVFPGTETTLELKGAAVDRLFTELRRNKDPRVALRMHDEDKLAVSAELTKIVRLPDERYLVTVRAVERVALGAVAQTEPFERVQATKALESDSSAAETLALAARVHSLWSELHEDEETTTAENPSAVADVVADELPLPREARRALLLELDVQARLQTVLRELTARRGAHEQAKEARAETRREILRAQLRQIKRELGDDSDADEDNDWVERVRAANLPADAQATALREARRLGTLGEGSAEANVARTYLEWLLELPWTRLSEETIDVAAARRVLDADHRGLGKVKKRILEYLSVRKLAPNKLSAPLRDRMEIIPIAGYPTAEKIDIALSHLWPKQLREHGVAEPMELTRPAVEEVVQGYTREAGVRNLERELASIARAVAVKVASGEAIELAVDVADIPSYLGPRKREDEAAAATLEPGTATGLAWTPTGGEILFVEATRMRGHGKLVLTGQLGDVMRESAMAALSWVRANATRLGIDAGVFAESDVHVHFPAGAIPKDGPSAGNALVSALVSLFTGRAVRADVAITGEITLRGAVLPVGGIADKLLAAHRAGIRRIILPERNAKDLVELPAHVRDDLDVVLVKRIDETLAAALEEAQVSAVTPLPLPRPSPSPDLRAA